MCLCFLTTGKISFLANIPKTLTQSEEIFNYLKFIREQNLCWTLTYWAILLEIYKKIMKFHLSVCLNDVFSQSWKIVFPYMHYSDLIGCFNVWTVYIMTQHEYFPTVHLKLIQFQVPCEILMHVSYLQCLWVLWIHGPL